MREGEITSFCERGIDDDAGRYRLTFSTKARDFGSLSMKPGTSFNARPLISATVVVFPFRCASPAREYGGYSRNVLDKRLRPMEIVGGLVAIVGTAASFSSEAVQRMVTVAATGGGMLRHPSGALSPSRPSADLR